MVKKGITLFEERFDKLLAVCQADLEGSTKSRDNIFDHLDVLNYDGCHKIIIKCSGLCIDFPDWIKSEKDIINPKTNDNKRF